MPVLRPYQQDAVTRIRAAFARRVRRVVLVLPTGGGKTVTFVFIADSAAARGKRVLLLCHRQELVDQISAALTAAGTPHGIIAAGYPETPGPVQVASIPTLARRLDRIEAPDLIVVDEAHHVVADSWSAILDAFLAARVLGVTATPERADGRGLGETFDEMVIGPSVAELIALEHLVPPVVYAPSTRLDLSKVATRAGDYDPGQLAAVMSSAALVGDAVAHYQRLAAGLPAVAFCVSRAHSELVAERFRAAGIAAAHIDGNTPQAERRAMLAALGTGGLQVLANCGLVSEGVDVPAIGAAILLRPTKSPGLYLQQVGRALRTSPGKTRALILDHAGNSLMHGLPDEDREWTLDAKPRRARKAAPEAAGRLRRCPACDALATAGTPVCGACGEPLRPTPEEQAAIDAELVRHERETAAALRAMDYPAVVRWADTPERLAVAARVKGYNPGWVRHRLREMAGAMVRAT
ncbi:DEAD/DEAH box helicase family protein [Methylobacterium aquaticum]|uniref:DEAD/DEAH box helicase family protein n=1 Tax=Methylobacterium aquaticum TaxID=270351 RepID=UPI003D1689A1